MFKKRGIFFTLDAILAVGIILTVIILVLNTYTSNPPENHVMFLSNDMVSLLSNIKVAEIENKYVQGLVSSGTIGRTNKSILEQIGELWSENELALAKNIAANVTESLVPARFGVGVYSDGEEIYAKNASVSRNLVSSRRIISGIIEGENNTLRTWGPSVMEIRIWE